MKFLDGFQDQTHVQHVAVIHSGGDQGMNDNAASWSRKGHSWCTTQNCTKCLLAMAVPCSLSRNRESSRIPRLCSGSLWGNKTHPVPKMLNHMSKLWSSTVYQELSLYQTWMVAKRILRNIPDIKGMVLRNV